jgi:hypothetical protein
MTYPCGTCMREAAAHAQQAAEHRRQLSTGVNADMRAIQERWAEDSASHGERARRRAVSHATDAHGVDYYDWSELQYCDMCGQDLPHDYVHWNGAFEQCEHCAALEALDPNQNCLDPIFGGTFRQGMPPIYGPPTLAP